MFLILGLSARVLILGLSARVLILGLSAHAFNVSAFSQPTRVSDLWSIWSCF